MILFIFILGTIFGSFVNLVIDRRIREESIIFPRSHCKYCGHNLSPLDLIPILSFLFLKGRCRYCGRKLSLFYPFMEIISGILLVAVYLVSESLTEFILFSICVYLALIIAMIDYKTMEYFSYHIYILLGLGIFYRYLFLGFDRTFIKFFLIFSLIYLILYLSFKDSLGDGDYFYYLGLALFLKSSNLLYYILFSIWIGAVFAIFKVIKYKSTKLKMAFCPYIFASFIMLIVLNQYGVLV